MRFRDRFEHHEIEDIQGLAWALIVGALFGGAFCYLLYCMEFPQ